MGLKKARAVIKAWTPQRPKFYWCGGCDHWHPSGYTGDCRNDKVRFTAQQLDELYPDENGDGWPDWIEVTEC